MVRYFFSFLSYKGGGGSSDEGEIYSDQKCFPGIEFVLVASDFEVFILLHR